MQGTNLSPELKHEPATVCDPGCGLRVGGREKRKIKCGGWGVRDWPYYLPLSISNLCQCDSRPCIQCIEEQSKKMESYSTVVTRNLPSVFRILPKVGGWALLPHNLVYTCITENEMPARPWFRGSCHRTTTT